MKKIIAVLLIAALVLCGALLTCAIAEAAEGGAGTAPLIDLTGIIIATLALVFDFLLAWIAKVIVPPIRAWLNENTNEKQRGLLWDAVTELVDAAEQVITGRLMGPRRKAYVKAGLQQRGLDVDEDMIEAAVKRMNDRLKVMAEETVLVKHTVEVTPEAGENPCQGKDYCELDEDGNEIPEEPESVNE